LIDDDTDFSPVNFQSKSKVYGWSAQQTVRHQLNTPGVTSSPL